jgi:adenine-specific DNA-methyltransferase
MRDAVQTLRRQHLSGRRYLGNKARLTSFLRRVILEEAGRFSSFADIFAGTGVVAAEFNTEDRRVVVGDILTANVVCLRAWFSPESHDERRMERVLQYLESVKPGGRGSEYMVRHYGGKYYHEEVAALLGAMRDAIEELELRPRERDIALAALIYTADRVAHTCGHFDTYRKDTPPRCVAVELRLPDVFPARRNRGNRIFLGDANAWVRENEADVLYLDPPYNSRQYGATYHVLENLARWEFPPTKGVAAKFAGVRELRSDYCRVRAPAALEDLVRHARCRHIFLSYNNMGNKGDKRSNAAIPDEEIERILSLRGPVRRHSVPFRHFTAGRRSIEQHAERLFHCRVTTPPE